MAPRPNITILMPINDIATEQTKVTEKTQAVKNQLLEAYPLTRTPPSGITRPT
jgi:hypothetical protein